MTISPFYVLVVKLVEEETPIRRVFSNPDLMLAYKELAEEMGHKVLRAKAFIPLVKQTSSATRSIDGK